MINKNEINGELIADKVIKFRYYFAVAIVVATIILGLGLNKVFINNSSKIWFDDNDISYQEYKKYISEFGHDNFLLIACKKQGLFNIDGINFIKQYTDSLETIQGIDRVVSLANTKAPKFVLWDLKWLPVLPNETNNSIRLIEKLKEDPLSSGLISKQGDAALFVVYTSDSSDNDIIFDKVVSQFDWLKEQNIHYSYFGSLPIKVLLDRMSTEESTKYVLLAILLMTLIIWVIFRNIKISILSLLTAVVVIVWTVGLMGWLKEPVNMVTSVVPLILIILSFTFSIHFYSTIRKYQLTLKPSATVSKVSKKILFSAITTSIGFVAFSFSGVDPFVKFGLFTALGTLFSFFLNYCIVLIIYPFIKFETYKPIKLYSENSWIKFNEQIFKYKKVISFGSMLFFVFSIIGILKIEVSTDQTDYFNENHSIRMNLTKVQEWFKSPFSMELVFHTDENFFKNKKNIKQLNSFSDEIKSITNVGSVNNPLDAIEYYAKKSNLKYSIEKVYDYASNFQSKQINYFSQDGKTVRMTVFFNWLSNKQIREMIKDIKTKFDQIPDNEFRMTITGEAALFSSLTQRLVYTQVSSLAVTFVLILLVFYLLFKEMKIALLSMIPNLFPVVATIGFLGWLNIPMNVGTSLLMSIGLGLAVDDTIHMMCGIRNNIKKSSLRKSILISLSDSGLPIIITTTIIVVGFSILMLSNYTPLMNLGLFVSINVALALIFDLVVLPAMLYSIEKYKNNLY